MTRYIKNVNMYLAQMKIKQTYISMKTDMDTKKISRILTGAQEASVSDMEKIASALGRRPEFFFSDAFAVPEITDSPQEKILFYAGEPTEKQEKIAGKLLKLMENVDEVMSARQCCLDIAEEQKYGY